MISFSVRVVHVIRRVSCHKVDPCLSPLVVAIVQVWVFVMRLTDGQDEADVSLPLHPHVSAHLGIASAVQNSALLLVEFAARAFGREPCFASTIVTGADDVAHFVLTWRKHLTFAGRHLEYRTCVRHTLAIFFCVKYAACSLRFISHCLVSEKRGETRTRSTTHSTCLMRRIMVHVCMG